MTDARILDEQVDGLSHTFRVSVDTGLVSSTVEVRLREMGCTARIPVFRPGRAPLAIVRNRYGERLRDTVIDHLAIDVPRKLIAEKGLEPSRRQRIHINEVDNASSASVTFTLHCLR